MRLAYQFQGQRSRLSGRLMLTHILRHILKSELYRIPLDVVVRCISRPFLYQFTPKLTRSILMSDSNIATKPKFRKSLYKSRILSPKKNSYLSISAIYAAAVCCHSDWSIAMTSRATHWRPRPIAFKSPTNSRSITNIGRTVLHDTCYIAHQFQRQRSRSQAGIVCTPRVRRGLFIIRETKCCTCVIRGRRGHTVSAEPGGHTSCSYRW